MPAVRRFEPVTAGKEGPSLRMCYAVPSLSVIHTDLRMLKALGLENLLEEKMLPGLIAFEHNLWHP